MGDVWLSLQGWTHTRLSTTRGTVTILSYNIYIYREREREREKQYMVHLSRKEEKEDEEETHIHTYIHTTEPTIHDSITILCDLNLLFTNCREDSILSQL